jgi:hypothetical protein
MRVRGGGGDELIKVFTQHIREPRHLLVDLALKNAAEKEAELHTKVSRQMMHSLLHTWRGKREGVFPFPIFRAHAHSHT